MNKKYILITLHTFFLLLYSTMCVYIELRYWCLDLIDYIVMQAFERHAKLNNCFFFLFLSRPYFFFGL